MGKELKNIEDLFKSSFEGHKVEPSDRVWKNISFKLMLNKFISAKFFGSIVVVAVVVFLSIFVFDIFEDKKVDLTDERQPNFEYTINQSEQDNENVDIQSTENTISETSGKIQLTKKSENFEIVKTENERTVDLALVIVSKSIKVLSNKNLDSLNFKTAKPPMPKFTVKSTEGCAPFELKLKNLTKSALAFEWNYGDGYISTEVSPRYIYRYPGVYKVILKAVGFGGVAVTYIDSIIVHDPPVARLSWPYESVIQTGQKVIIPNESENISETEWNFGDQCISNELNGKHVFNKEGTYSIVLKVWSENGCKDSMVIEKIKVVKPKGIILFPSAFTPNIEGPSSGYYSNVNYHNDIFYPKVNAKVSSYEIRIYSKAGGEIFKSTDILYGWNGYYRNRLLPQGVYLYIASGEFEGGQKFYKKGNVTILHKK